MENLDLTSNLVNLKIKSKAPVQIYFVSQVFQSFFFTAKFFDIFFIYRYMGICTKGGLIDQMAILTKKQKRHKGKSERGAATTPHRPEREG